MLPSSPCMIVSSFSLRAHVVHVAADDVIKHAQQWMSGQHNVNPKDKPKRVVVLNWMQDVDTLLQHFSDFSPAGSEIVFVHQEKKSIPKRIGSVRFRQVQCCCLLYHSPQHSQPSRQFDNRILLRGSWQLSSADLVFVLAGSAIGYAI